MAAGLGGCARYVRELQLLGIFNSLAYYAGCKQMFMTSTVVQRFAMLFLI